MLDLAVELGYKIVFGEWPQGITSPQISKIATRHGFKIATEEDYDKVKYPIGERNRINYVRYLS